MSRLVTAVIPARYGATRLPGKALEDVGGVPMVVRVYQRVLRARRVGSVVVATDDVRIANVVRAHGGRALMTRADHASGTDRVAEAAALLDCDRVINVQGDEPLIDPAVIDALVAALDDPAVAVATVAAPLTDDPFDPNVVKVVCDPMGRALYFSRAAIPHGGPYLQHLGLYGFQRAALDTFATRSPTPLERVERLEQLRFLEHGMTVQVVRVSAPSPSVDTPADLQAVRRLILLSNEA